MRLVWLAVLAVLLSCPLKLSSALAEDEPADEASTDEAPDPWVGCWTRVYDAAHLAKHPGQKVTALTLSIGTREPSGDSDPGPYLAKLAGKFRDKTDVYVMPSGGRCVVTGAAKDHLSCVTDGFFVGKFELAPAAKNMKIVLQGSDEHIALVPGIDTASFVLLSPDNPEHSLFVLNQAAAKLCRQ
ncbi:MAG: hypothetical protein WAU90_04605 [Methyloceanibacter sp.]